MSYDFKPIYTFTLQEVFGWHKLVWANKDSPVRNSLEPAPFDEIEKKPLLDELTYQAAMTSAPIPGGIWDAMVKAEVGPAPNLKDKRTGVIIFKGDQIVGSMTDAGICNPVQYSYFVHPDHRDQDIGQAVIVALWTEFPRNLKLGTRIVENQYGAYAAVSAWPKYIKRCQDAGEPVPQRVIDSVESDMEVMKARIKALKPRA